MSDRSKGFYVDSLSHLLATLRVNANVFHNGQYCGNWAIDTSGSHYISFHAVSYGQCFVKMEGQDEVHTLHAGDVILFPRDAKHVLTSDQAFTQAINTEQSVGFEHLEPNGTGLVCGYFEHQHPMINEIIGHLPPMIIVTKHQQADAPLSLLTESLLVISKQAGDGVDLMLERLSECILAALLRDHLPLETGILAAMADPKLAPAIKAIFEQPEQKWSVEQLAERCFCSRTSFATLFKQTLGKSPGEFATQWRLGLAYRTLADDGVTTLAAALSCGYESEASFSKAFKRTFGISPGQLRK